jgi:hypothetical protein
MTYRERKREPFVLDPEAEHTVKNHLAVIVGFCDLLIADTPADDPRHHDLQEVNRSARALLALFNREPPTSDTA